VQNYVPLTNHDNGAYNSDSDNSDSQGLTLDGDRDKLSKLLELPRIGPPVKRKRTSEPLVDYSKSIILTRDTYIALMKKKECRKEQAEKKHEEQHLEAEWKKLERVVLKEIKEAEKLRKVADARAQKAFRERWSTKAVAAAGQQLHNTIKENIAPPAGAYTSVFHGNLPSVCRENQMISKARLWAKQHDRSKL
jgi:hypothetical protein